MLLPEAQGTNDGNGQGQGKGPKHGPGQRSHQDGTQGAPRFTIFGHRMPIHNGGSGDALARNTKQNGCDVASRRGDSRNPQ